jgi:hypothetical protein
VSKITVINHIQAWCTKFSPCHPVTLAPYLDLLHSRDSESSCVYWGPAKQWRTPLLSARLLVYHGNASKVFSRNNATPTAGPFYLSNTHLWREVQTKHTRTTKYLDRLESHKKPPSFLTSASTSSTAPTPQVLPPKHPHTQTRDPAPTSLKVPCHFYKLGICKHGPACKFSHNDGPPKDCPWQPSGQCEFSHRCTF